MGSLLAFLYAHPRLFGPVVVLHGRHPTYALRIMHHVCTRHHELLAFAQYAHHAVLYCYPK